MAKTKLMVSGVDLDKLKELASFPALSVAKEWKSTQSTVLVANTECMPNAAD